MATFTDDFATASDTNLGARADWVNFDAANFNDELRAYAATGRVYARLANGHDHYRFTRSGLPTGTQETRFDYASGIDSTFRASLWVLPSGSGAALNAYELEILSGVEVRIKRWVNGTPTQIASGLAPGASALLAVRFRATVNAGTSVVLEAQIGAGATLTFTDTDASRPTSGTAGLGYQGDNTGTSYIDNFVVDDLSSSTTPVSVNSSMGYESVLGLAPVASASAEGIQGTSALPLGPFESLQDRAATHAATLEALRGLAPQFAQSFEAIGAGTTPVSRGLDAAIETLQPITGPVVSGVDAQRGISAAAAHAIEALLGASVSRAAALEAYGYIDTWITTAFESAGLLSVPVGHALEQLQQAFVSRANLYETTRQLSVASAQQLENLGQGTTAVSQAIVQLYEALDAIAAQTASSAEILRLTTGVQAHALDALQGIDAPSVLAFESLDTAGSTPISAAVTVTFEVSAPVSSAAPQATESVSATGTAIGAALESLLNVSSDVAAHIELLLGVAAIRVAAIEAAGSGKIAVTLVLPYTAFLVDEHGTMIPTQRIGIKRGSLARIRTQLGAAFGLPDDLVAANYTVTIRLRRRGTDVAAVNQVATLEPGTGHFAYYDVQPADTQELAKGRYEGEFWLFAPSAPTTPIKLPSQNYLQIDLLDDVG